MLDIKAFHTWSVPAEAVKIPAPRSVTVAPDQTVYALDDGGRILVYSPDGTFLRKWFMPEYSVGRPEGICVLKDQRIAVCDTHYHRLVFFHPDGSEAGRFGERGEGPGQFEFPVAVVQDDDQFLYVAEYGGNDRVQKFHPDGTFVLSFGSFGTGDGQLNRASGMVWHEGKIYIADAANNRVVIYSDEGDYLGLLNDPTKPYALRFPYDITMCKDGTFIIVEYAAGRVTRTHLDGRLIGRYGEQGTGIGQMQTPWGLDIDDRMRLRIADTGNRRIVEIRL